jgi:FlaA1/EpsC-like NDP-sugar epimerase
MIMIKDPIFTMVFLDIYQQVAQQQTATITPSDLSRYFLTIGFYIQMI